MEAPSEFRVDHIPLGYLITFRAYGTWLHGRAGSVDRFHHSYGSPTLPADGARYRYNRRALLQPPVTLGARERTLVQEAIRETCEVRQWRSWAINARTNHVHAVVTTNCNPERALSAFKANATRKLKEAKCWQSERSPWAYRGSRRYLWTEEALYDAIEYVLHDQD
jgi:REP element-mobilizing transposase RayT